MMVGEVPSAGWREVYHWAGAVPAERCFDGGGVKTAESARSGSEGARRAASRSLAGTRDLQSFVDASEGSGSAAVG